MYSRALRTASQNAPFVKLDSILGSSGALWRRSVATTSGARAALLNLVNLAQRFVVDRVRVVRDVGV